MLLNICIGKIPMNLKKILEDIQTKIPNITEIKPVKLQTGQMVLEFKQDGFEQSFFSQRMSDGTLKLFAYYLLLHERNPRQLIFVEEPENGLYHQYLGSLALEMKKNVGTGFSKQLFVTTHSPFFLSMPYLLSRFGFLRKMKTDFPLPNKLPLMILLKTLQQKVFPWETSGIVNTLGKGKQYVFSIFN